MLQLMFFRLKVSEAAPNTAISMAPAARAASRPFMLGTSTGYATPGFFLMPAMTCAWSAI